MSHRILFIIKVPPPVTGAALMNRHIANSNKIRAAFNTDFILINYNENRSEFGKVSIRKTYTILKVINKIILKLQKHKPHLVYFQITPTGYAFIRDSLYACIIKLFKVRIVFHLRGTGINDEAKNKFKRGIYKYIFKNNSIICHSELVAKDFKSVFQGTYHVVENGIPVVLNDELIELSRREGRIPTLLYLSTLRKSKGIFDFIEALVILKKDKVEFKAVIIGEPTSELSVQSLKELLKRTGLAEVVKVPGPKYDDEKFDYLLDADIFVFPTLFEAFGNVVLEAFQASLPVIASDEGSLPVIVDNGVDGFLYKKGETGELVEKMKILIEDGDLRNQMGANGREKYLRKYTLEKFESRMIDVLGKI